MRKALKAASAQCKKNNDSFLGVDTLLRALLENRDIAGILSEAGDKSPALLDPSSIFPILHAAC